jgi:hypothetical protein
MEESRGEGFSILPAATINSLIHQSTAATSCHQPAARARKTLTQVRRLPLYFLPHYPTTPPLRTPAALNLMIGKRTKVRIVAAKNLK